MKDYTSAGSVVDAVHAKKTRENDTARAKIFVSFKKKKKPYTSP
jgi:hypothetical protein